MYSAVTQSENVAVLVIRGGKLSLKQIGSRYDVNPHFSMRCKLRWHVDSAGKVDYSLLK